MTKFEVFEVGGAVRDELLGLSNKDVDFTVVGPETFEEMEAELVARGFRVFLSTPDTFTVRAKVPASMPELLARTDVADFVLARKESSASDGRRPDSVESGTLEDDLARRDFTVNAMARALDGSLVDLFDGEADLATMTLRFVGDPMTRVREDALRVLRGFRFMVTKGFTPDPETMAVLTSAEAAELFSAVRPDGRRVVSSERVAEELDKMFRFDALATMRLLLELPEATREALMPAGVKVKAKVAFFPEEV